MPARLVEEHVVSGCNARRRPSSSTRSRRPASVSKRPGSPVDAHAAGADQLVGAARGRRRPATGTRKRVQATRRLQFIDEQDDVIWCRAAWRSAATLSERRTCAGPRRRRRGRPAAAAPTRLSRPNTRSKSGVVAVADRAAARRRGPPRRGAHARPGRRRRRPPRRRGAARCPGACTGRGRRRSRASRAPPARGPRSTGRSNSRAHAAAASREARNAQPPATCSSTMPLRPSR